MVKKLGIVLLLMLALNFIAIAGGIAYLFSAGKLDQEKVRAVGKIVFPDPVPATQPATQPADSETRTDDPLFKIDELLNAQAGKTAAEQVQVVRDAYEKLATQLDRQRREVVDLRRQVDVAQAQVVSDRAALAERAASFDAKVAARQKQNADAGFQRTMQIYDEMKPRQLKDLLSKMDDATMVRYLQAMDPSRVSRIVNEFTAPEEKDRARRLLDQMRLNADEGAEATRDAGQTPANDDRSPLPPQADARP